MLKIEVPDKELFNQETNEFIKIKGAVLTLEHSLISLSKWESKWHKSYLETAQHKAFTTEEVLDYIRCMTLTQNVDPLIYKILTKDNFIAINNYINDPMTATTVTSLKKEKPKHKVITAEIIYYWMIALNIPPEYQKWHLTRLLTLIDVCQIEQSQDNKMNRKDTLNHYRDVNAARRKAAKAKARK